ncbi:MAG: hypothetical protein BWY35_02099 [Firmicutes bacterium ADurb.Bin248]|jgi:hypothetical protein|nr:MAG: hypothetical protein BWY35_02099 [Firmicutes bacterium ADurb.Bin248]HOG01024.1 hypothetical protein [Clostridia bacterium]
MNYFGLFFTFLVPGVVLGVMAAAAFHQEAKARARRARQRPARNQSAVVRRDRLYVHDLSRAA